MPTARRNPIRCPECNRLGSNDVTVKHLCKSCLAKKMVCVQCGKGAFGYIERSPLHSWYCEDHYNDQMERWSDERRQHIINDGLGDNIYTINEPLIPEIDEVGLMKNKFGYEE